ncbi:MAG: hypothetical protein A2Y15_04850 [Clostridiales bacterium GWF2_36_10]|nr:MAG: hypothetical protein A2Y15_04850 [Clostridiales bacterium GWF2_36_10]HAN20837.1 hypothetical protein [Clostridiales bacterium]
MRLTNSMMSKNYLKNLNSSLENLNEANTRVTAQRKYMKISEDPATALKAMKVRKNLSRIEVYKENLSDAQAIFDQYESTISNINDIATEAVSQVLQGTTGTSNETVRKTVATTLRGYQETILAAANTKYGDDYIFGGESVGNTPFKLNGTGELLYNGQNVNTGTFTDEYRFVDIGVGLTVGTDGEIVPKSAFNVSNSGSTLLGTGVDTNGITNNLYNLLGEIATKLENNDIDDIQLYSDKLEAKADDIRLQYVSIGEKTNFISYFTERLDAERINATTKQNELESMDIEEGIIIFGEQELAYNACLQMGTKILQPSLIDFLR